jgi:hypothetical protein
MHYCVPPLLRPFKQHCGVALLPHIPSDESGWQEDDARAGRPCIAQSFGIIREALPS